MKQILLALPKTASTSLMKAVQELTGAPSIQQFEWIDTPKHERGSPWQREMRRFKRKTIEALFPQAKFAHKLRCLFPAQDWKALAAMHSDICDFGIDAAAHLDAMAESRFIYKQHFPPTLANIALLSDWKKIILVRDVDQVVEAYGRALGENVALARFYALSDYRTRLREELDRWRKGWEAQPDALVIRYEELTGDQIGALRRTLDFFGYAETIPEGYRLPKERYTR